MCCSERLKREMKELENQTRYLEAEEVRKELAALKKRCSFVPFSRCTAHVARSVASIASITANSCTHNSSQWSTSRPKWTNTSDALSKLGKSALKTKSNGRCCLWATSGYPSSLTCWLAVLTRLCSGKARAETRGAVRCHTAQDLYPQVFVEVAFVAKEADSSGKNQAICPGNGCALVCGRWCHHSLV